MQSNEQMNLVGMVIGSVAQNAPPLVYALHVNALYEVVVEIVEFSQYDTSQEILRVLKQSLGTRIINIFENDSIPCWYYVQMNERYPTHKMAHWPLPITVYFAQWSLHSAT